MDAIIQENQEESEKKARIGVIIWTILALFILIFPFMTYQDPPPGQEGILVNLGIPDMGDGEENGAASIPEDTTSESESDETETESEPESEPENQPEEKPDPKPEKPKENTKPKEVIKDDAESIAIKKQKEKEKKERDAKKKAEREAQKKADAKKKAEEEAKRKKAEEAARKKAELEAKKAAANDLKNKLGGLFGNGNGQGDNGTSGNQGDPNGDPDAKNLEGISTGSGKVGGGLASRGGSGPNIQDNSQATGTVVINVCVDENGKVLSAKYTLSGSNTQNTTLIKLAEQNARKWTFKDGNIDKQCGSITYEFKVK